MLVMLTVPDEPALARTAAFLELRTDTERFFEPDLDFTLTAVAAAGDSARKRLGRLPLLLREEVKQGGREHVLASGEGRGAEGCA